MECDFIKNDKHPKKLNTSNELNGKTTVYSKGYVDRRITLF